MVILSRHVVPADTKSINHYIHTLTRFLLIGLSRSRRATPGRQFVILMHMDTVTGMETARSRLSTPGRAPKHVVIPTPQRAALRITRLPKLVPAALKAMDTETVTMMKKSMSSLQELEPRLAVTPLHRRARGVHRDTDTVMAVMKKITRQLSRRARSPGRRNGEEIGG